MSETKHLYLNTLEIEPLEVGESYNPLPAHLTLISRYWSELQPDEITIALRPLFEQVREITLTFGNNEIIGPKQTPVHIVVPDAELTGLHNRLKQVLDSLGVTYAYPQFVGEYWKPHVSRREETSFSPGNTLRSGATYLIEVSQATHGDLRNIRSKFNFQP